MRRRARFASPPPRRGPEPRQYELREVVNAVRYLQRRDLLLLGAFALMAVSFDQASGALFGLAIALASAAFAVPMTSRG